MRSYITAFIFIIIAIFSRTVRYTYTAGLPDSFFNLLRISIYIGLFSIWGISVMSRVIQRRARRLLMAIAGLMVLWLVVRELKFHYVTDPDALRYLWYSYYIPMLGIPLLSVFVALSIGRLNDRHFPVWTRCLTAVTLFLIGLVMTNERHQFVFIINEVNGVWSDFDYRYNVGFYPVISWAFFCSVLAIIIMINISGKHETKRILWLPLAPFIMAFVYVVLYAMRISFVTDILGDTTVVFCLSIAGIFEGCIRGGLIQSNTMYSGLFAATRGISVRITDNEYNVRHTADEEPDIDKAVMMSAEDSPVILNNGRRLHNMAVNGGHVIWTEDISEVMRINEELTELGEELTERNELLMYEYEREKEYASINEQNRLYDILQEKTQRQIDNIDRLVNEYRQTADEEERRIILAHILVLGTFVKRRKDFVLSLNESSEVSKDILAGALRESYRSLGYMGIKGSFHIGTEREYLSENELTLIYDFFENVLERNLYGIRYINLRIYDINDRLRINILTDINEDNMHQKDIFMKNLIINSDEDGTEYILELEGGGLT